ncbi:hypothetical protein SNEBB_007009 [Seison nebaliae]|nr:hypothetical protein SNEBB_007009 [Seison nebaliae]
MIENEIGDVPQHVNLGVRGKIFHYTEDEESPKELPFCYWDGMRRTRYISNEFDRIQPKKLKRLNDSNNFNLNLSNIIKDDEDLVRRFARQNSIQVHNGCVNTVSWNSDGRYILSGSDDQRLVVTDVWLNKCRFNVKTPHHTNIFSAKFFPYNEENCVSLSADGMICLTDLQLAQEYSSSTLNGDGRHDTRRMKKEQFQSFSPFFCLTMEGGFEVATSSATPSLFYACGRDGTVREYDMRETSSCLCYRFDVFEDTVVRRSTLKNAAIFSEIQLEEENSNELSNKEIMSQSDEWKKLNKILIMDDSKKNNLFYKLRWKLMEEYDGNVDEVDKKFFSILYQFRDAYVKKKKNMSKEEIDLGVKLDCVENSRIRRVVSDQYSDFWKQERLAEFHYAVNEYKDFVDDEDVEMEKLDEMYINKKRNIKSKFGKEKWLNQSIFLQEKILNEIDRKNFKEQSRDGLVRSDGCRRHILLEAECGVTTFSIHPLEAQYIAIGSSDPSIRIYDRRMLGRSTSNVQANNWINDWSIQKKDATYGLVAIYRPGEKVRKDDEKENMEKSEISFEKKKSEEQSSEAKKQRVEMMNEEMFVDTNVSPRSDISCNSQEENRHNFLTNTDPVNITSSSTPNNPEDGDESDMDCEDFHSLYPIPNYMRLTSDSLDDLPSDRPMTDVSQTTDVIVTNDDNPLTERDNTDMEMTNKNDMQCEEEDSYWSATDSLTTRNENKRIDENQNLNEQITLETDISQQLTLETDIGQQNTLEVDNDVSIHSMEDNEQFEINIRQSPPQDTYDERLEEEREQSTSPDYRNYSPFPHRERSTSSEYANFASFPQRERTISGLSSASTHSSSILRPSSTSDSSSEHSYDPMVFNRDSLVNSDVYYHRPVPLHNLNLDDDDEDEEDDDDADYLSIGEGVHRATCVRFSENSQNLNLPGERDNHDELLVSFSSGKIHLLNWKNLLNYRGKPQRTLDSDKVLGRLSKSTSSLKRLEECSFDNIGRMKLIKKFYGHRNMRTMIKEVHFWGNNFVVGGSDCGRIFFWRKTDGRIIKTVNGDVHVVNCIQPHPTLPFLCSSGIETVYYIWTAMNEKIKDQNCENINFPSKEREPTNLTMNEMLIEEEEKKILAIIKRNMCSMSQPHRSFPPNMLRMMLYVIGQQHEMNSRNAPPANERNADDDENQE